MARPKKNDLQDWQTIEDPREKRHAYMCSREWGEKKEAVRERCGGICERCMVLPMYACHHLSYHRLYEEDLEDLAGLCHPCHEYNHSKAGFNPAEHQEWIEYLVRCKEIGLKCVPEVLLYREATPMELETAPVLLSIEALVKSYFDRKMLADQIRPGTSEFGELAWFFNATELLIDEFQKLSKISFDYAGWILGGKPTIAKQLLEESLSAVGVEITVTRVDVVEGR